MVEMRMLEAKEPIANLNMLTKGIDGCTDISSRMTVIETFQDSNNQSIEDSFNIGLRKNCYCHIIVG
jgi:hypothetical protein